jgi:hypothetical protein
VHPIQSTYIIVKAIIATSTCMASTAITIIATITRAASSLIPTVQTIRCTSSTRSITGTTWAVRHLCVPISARVNSSGVDPHATDFFLRRKFIYERSDR